jgi:hypothetical protein
MAMMILFYKLMTRISEFLYFLKWPPMIIGGFNYKTSKGVSNQIRFTLTMLRWVRSRKSLAAANRHHRASAWPYITPRAATA